MASALSNGQNCTFARKHYKHNEDGRTAPGVCGNGSVPLSHSGNVVTIIGIHTGIFFLQAFLSKILKVFLELVQPEVFPKDWTTMRMVTNKYVCTIQGWRLSFLQTRAQLLKTNNVVS